MHTLLPEEILNPCTSWNSILSPDGVILFVEKEVKAFTGYKPDELTGKKALDFFHAQHKPLIKWISQSPGEEAYYSFQHKKGGFIKVKVEGRSLREDNGLMHSIFVKFTAQEKKSGFSARNKCTAGGNILQKGVAIPRQQDRLYRSMFENNPDLIIITDKQGLIIESNENKLVKAFDDSRDVTGKNFLEYLTEENRRKLSGKLPDLLMGHNIQLEAFFQKAFKPFHGLVSIGSYENEGAITGFFIQIRDITERIQQEQEEALLNKVYLALNNAASLSFGIQEVISLFCQYTNFHYGEYWMPMLGHNYLVMKSLWFEDASLSSFAAHSRHRKFELPHQLPPLLSQKEACFCGNLEESTELNRKNSAKATGLHSYLTVPLIYREKFMGAVVLFSKHQLKEPGIPPANLQNILNKLGAEIEKRRANEELDKFFNLNPDLFGIVGTDGLFKKINPAFEKLLGFTKKEFFSVPFIDFIHPEDREATLESVKRAAQGMATENFVIRCKQKNKGYLWISWTNKPAAEEGLIYIAGRDITDKKKQLEEIKQIKVAVESSSDAILIAGPDLKVRYINEAFRELIGWSEGVLNSGGVKNFFTMEGLKAEIIEALNKTGKWVGDVQILNKQNDLREFNLRCDVVKDENGKIRSYVGIFTDITERKKADSEILKLNKAVEESSNEIYIIDPVAGKFSYVNKRAEENTGYNSEELKSISLIQLIPELPLEKGRELAKPLLEGLKKDLMINTTHVRKDGSSYPVEAHLSLFEFGRTSSIMVQVIDITERIQAEEALRTSNERYQLATKATHDAIWDWDLSSNLIYLGDGYNTLFSHNLPNHIGVEQWIRFIHPEDTKRVVEALFERIASDTKQWAIEYRYKCADGSYKFIRERAYLMHDEKGKTIRMTGAMSDISEQKKNESLLKEFNTGLEIKVNEKTTQLREVLQKMKGEMEARSEAEKVLQDSLKEKDILLKEIHHRVKNNMAIISGLLSLQARQTNQQEVKALFKDSQSRIKSMALIHEHLYQNRNLSRISFRHYIKELIREISLSFPFKEKEISIQVKADDYELDIIHAVPCGLILNELVTNCFKYAFTEKSDGVIIISFIKKEDQFILKVQDNGIGLPEEFSLAKPESLGLKLVCNLTKQLNGTLKVKSNSGASFVIKFPEKSWQ